MTTSQPSPRYDVIVIGSGIGGATAASLLARFFDQRVLLLEKHWQFGGLTHEFTFDGKSFATGVHYLGNVNDGKVPDKLFDLLTEGQARWRPMPHRYDRIILPEYSFAYPAGKENWLAELSAEFPEDAKALKRFLTHARRAMRMLAGVQMTRSFGPRWLARFVWRMRRVIGFDPNASVEEYLDDHFQNPTLKRLLAAQWCDHGVKPSEASFMVQAMIMLHYLDGAYYPEGGPATLARGLRAGLERHGAEIRLRHTVTEILTEGERAYGVTARDENGNEQTFLADTIISNVGVEATYGKLLPQHRFECFERDRAKLTAPYDFFSVYLSLSDSPTKLGFDGSNQWIFRTDDHDSAVLPPDDPRFPGFYCLLFPSLKAGDAQHSMEILTSVAHETFAGWEGSAWKRRDPAYYARKTQMVERILDDIEARYPGFRAMVKGYDASTPLTTESFVGRAKGSSYGVPFTTERLKMDWLSNRTPLANLYLSGQDAFGPGIMGAMMGGVAAAAKAQGGFKAYGKIMSQVAKHHLRRNDASFTLRVREVQPETADAYTIRFEPTEGFMFQAGQFVVLSHAVAGQTLRRSYSLSSTPDDPYPSLTIKRIPGGQMSNHLGDHLQPGEAVVASSAKGSFVIPPEQRGKDLLLIAAGSGITPIFSLLRDTLANQTQNRMRLLYASRRPEDTIFRSQLDALAAQYPQALRVDYLWSEPREAQGLPRRLQPEELREALRGFDRRNLLVYVCAPGGLVQQVWDTLHALNFDAAQFWYESFTAQGLNLHGESLPGVAATVHHAERGQTFTAAVAAGQTLMSGLLAEQHSVEHSCLSGDCEICRCRLVAGTVTSVHGQQRRDHQAGEVILPCVSYATAEKIALEKV